MAEGFKMRSGNFTPSDQRIASMKPDGTKYLDTAQCAEYIIRSPGAVRNLVMRRAIPFRKLGGRLLFLREEIDKWIEKAPGLRFEDMRNG